MKPESSVRPFTQRWCWWRCLPPRQQEPGWNLCCDVAGNCSQQSQPLPPDRLVNGFQRLWQHKGQWDSPFVNNKFVANKSVVMYLIGMIKPALKRSTGNWVVGDRFWDRETELGLFKERLNEGARILFVPPRRIGK